MGKRSSLTDATDYFDTKCETSVSIVTYCPKTHIKQWIFLPSYDLFILYSFYKNLGFKSSPNLFISTVSVYIFEKEKIKFKTVLNVSIIVQKNYKNAC